MHPGDSVYVEIDFKDMFHPKVTGDAEKLNQEILAFTENAYYYIQNYSIGSNLNNNDFETELKREYNLRLERRQEYIQKYKPSEEVEFLTEELLKQVRSWSSIMRCCLKLKGFTIKAYYQHVYLILLKV